MHHHHQHSHPLHQQKIFPLWPLTVAAAIHYNVASCVCVWYDHHRKKSKIKSSSSLPLSSSLLPSSSPPQECSSSAVFLEAHMYDISYMIIIWRKKQYYIIVIITIAIIIVLTLILTTGMFVSCSLSRGLQLRSITVWAAEQCRETFQMSTAEYSNGSEILLKYCSAELCRCLLIQNRNLLQTTEALLEYAL